MSRFDVLRVALGSIAANRLRSSLTMLGMLIGVASVILLVAVGNGSSAAVEAKIQELGTNLLVVAPRATFASTGSPTPATSLTQSDVRALENRTTNPDVISVAPVISASVTMAYGNSTYAPLDFVGTTPAYRSMHGYSLAGGSFFTRQQVQSHARVIVVGQTVVQGLFGGADPIGDQVRCGAANFEVIGVLAPKGSNGLQSLDNVVMAPYTSVQDQISGYGPFSSVDLEAASASQATAAQAEAAATVESVNHTSTASPGFEVVNQATLLQTSSAARQVFTALLGAVAAISLLVGGIGVMNIMLVSVTERTREIGIRKTVGARRADILTQFLAEAVLLSMLGGLAGVAVGLLGSAFKIEGIQPVVAWYSVALAFGVSAAVGLFFGLYPASRAAALPPAVALRRD
ncbi:MAG: ABC transporter permease [Actinomycetota bacterium]|nr:ABC transporter permease [Actinomycetota bacterium]